MSYPRHDFLTHVQAEAVSATVKGCPACDQRGELIQRVLDVVNRAKHDHVNVAVCKLCLHPETWKTIVATDSGILPATTRTATGQALYGIPVILDGALPVGDITLRWEAKA